MYQAPIAYTARRPVRLAGTDYEVGDPVPADVIRTLKVSVLVSRGYLQAHPDPYARKSAGTSKPAVTYIAPSAMPIPIEDKTEGSISHVVDGDDPLRVTFDADFNGPTYWLFGDGNHKDQQDNHTTHWYAASGTYTVRVESHDSWAETSVTVTSTTSETNREMAGGS